MEEFGTDSDDEYVNELLKTMQSEESAISTQEERQFMCSIHDMVQGSTSAACGTTNVDSRFSRYYFRNLKSVRDDNDLSVEDFSRVYRRAMRYVANYRKWDGQGKTEGPEESGALSKIHKKVRGDTCTEKGSSVLINTEKMTRVKLLGSIHNGEDGDGASEVVVNLGVHCT